MDETYLYQRIAESIRRDILEGRLKPGDRIPSMRELSEQWTCTLATVQRAFNELSRDGLLVSRVGRGTQVTGSGAGAPSLAPGPLRKAGLVHQAESFLLEALTSGYTPDEIQLAIDMAMDRWRSVNQASPSPDEDRRVDVIRFMGSHDMVLNALEREYFGRILKGAALQVTYNGSLGGLMALAERRCDIAGCHLLDAETGSYNLPFVSRLLPGSEIVVKPFAYRRQGLIIARGNPLGIRSLEDLAREGVRYCNRQPGSGTRVWLDAQLDRLNILRKAIQGYQDERSTHSDVARAVAEGKADAGLGLECAAAAFSLDFIFLNRERYDLVMRAETTQRPAVQAFLGWLRSPDGQDFICRYPGYEAAQE